MLSPLLASWPLLAQAAGLMLAALIVGRVLWRRTAILPPRLKHTGIAVGDTKVYDNRSLVLMLEQLKDQLKEMQKLDGPKPSDAIGAQQASSSASTKVSAGITIPGDGKETPGARHDAGTASDSDAKATEAPALKWSERASDLLADQVNLNYDIFNLQLLLERAISDRMMPLEETKSGDWGESGEEGAAGEKRQPGRVQAVLGIPISLDPPAYAAGCAAIVEVRLRAAYPLSLVVLFPQEDTYNTAISGHRRTGISVSSTQAGAGASGSVDSSHDTSAIRRTVDTVAFQREDASPNELIFGWEFFPGVGCPSVAPGVRQMLAVVSLAQADEGGEPVNLSIETRTLWREFNSTTLTVTDRCGWRALLTNRPVESAWSAAQAIQVLKTKSIEDGLHPVIDDIECHRVGETAVVVVNGDNFFTGTSVIMGDQVYAGRETGLVLKSSRAMQIQVPLKALATTAVLNGRYGPSQELCIHPCSKFDLPLLSIQGTQIIPTKTGYVIRMLLGPRENGPARAVGELRETGTAPSLMDALGELARPVLAIDSRCVPSGVTYSPGPDPAKQVWANVSVDRAAVRTEISMLLRLTFPLCGPDWSLEYQTYDLRQGVQVIRRIEGDKTKLFFSGAIFGLDPTLMVWIDRGYRIQQSPNPPGVNGDGLALIGQDLMILTVDTKVASTYQWLFFFSSWGSQRVAILDAPPPVEKPPDSPAAPEH